MNKPQQDVNTHQNTILWHDYETWGANPFRDRASQFAAVRTDLDLNIIEEPVEFFCQMSPDYLPHPEAALVTGLTPQLCQRKGVPEADFIRLINEQFSRPGTCVAGYNSIRFDDEVSRQLYYRNLYDPYAREYKNGNSRWDIIDVVRACHALRPEGIEWPTDENGVPTFRLEKLTDANGIGHETAHDAVSDVIATIEMAKLIKQKQPKLYGFLFGLRNKHKVSEIINAGEMAPIVHVSSRIPATQGCTSWVVPIAAHPSNANEVICIDLHQDISTLEDYNADQIRELLYTKTAELPEGVNRPPIKNIHINKCPVVAPPKTLTADDATRLGIDREYCLDNLKKLKAMPALKDKLIALFSQPRQSAGNTDPDFGIYEGFFSRHDTALMEQIRERTPEQLSVDHYEFKDERLYELLFRYRARNYPQTLSEAEQQKWQSFCYSRLYENQNIAGLCMTSYIEKIQSLAQQHHGNDKKISVLKQLAAYVEG